MLPTSLAYGVTIWRRHRWGLLANAGFLLLAGIAISLLSARFALLATQLCICELLIALFYLVPVFSYGFDAGDINARTSCFPAGLFTLPVRTGTLVGWPMFYGAAVVASVWLITAALILRPWFLSQGEVIPLWWPAMLAVTALAWMQALLWSSVGFSGLRVVLIVILMVILIIVPQISVSAGASESFLVALLAGFTLVAWAIAYRGVMRARRGDVPSWDGIFSPFNRLARWLPRRRQPFASAAQAQVWFEWRSNGNSLPIMTALVLPFMLLFLAFAANDVISTGHTLLSALLLPGLIAVSVGMTGNWKIPGVKRYDGLPPFTAVLPVTTTALVGAKLKMAARSTLAAWMVVAACTSLALLLTGKLHEVTGWWQQAVHDDHPAKVIAGIGTGAVLLVLWTWKRHVDGMFTGMTGRAWIAFAGLLMGFIAPCSLYVVAVWISKQPETHETTRAVLPVILSLVLLCRLLAAGWALRLALRRGLLEARTITRWLTGWLLLAITLFGLCVWIVPEGLFPTYYLAFGVLFALPMARLSATPLALAWNRHR